MLTCFTRPGRLQLPLCRAARFTVSADVPPPPGTQESLLADLAGDTPPQPPPDAYPPPSPPKPSTPTKNPLRAKALPYVRPIYHLHCKAGRNNTITHFTTPDGKPLAIFSGGRCGFKKSNRASYEAGYQCAIRVFGAIAERAANETFDVALHMKGFGVGRNAMKTALLAPEGKSVRELICSIGDRTPIKIGGTRSKKARRL